MQISITKVWHKAYVCFFVLLHRWNLFQTAVLVKFGTTFQKMHMVKSSAMHVQPELARGPARLLRRTPLIYGLILEETIDMLI